MAIAFFQWLFGSGSSTGAHGTIFDGLGLRDCRNLSFHIAKGAETSTVSVGIEAGLDSTSPFVRMGSTAYALSSGEIQVVQLTGPLQAVRPYLIARTDSNAIVRVVLHGE